VKYKHFDHATTVNSTKTLSNGNGDIDGLYHRTLSDVQVSRPSESTFYDSKYLGSKCSLISKKKKNLKVIVVFVKCTFKY